MDDFYAARTDNIPALPWPNIAPPFISATVAVKKFIEGTGLTIAKTFSGMPDHIGAEFEFMQVLARKEAEAWSQGDEELGSNILKIEKRFFDEHLSQWVSSFCDKIFAASAHPFYHQFAIVTQEFMKFEATALAELIERSKQNDKLSACG